MADMPASGTRIRRPNPPGRSPTRGHFSPSQPGSPRHLRPPGPTSTTSDGRREEDDMNGSANTMAGAEGFGFGARRGRTEEEEDFKNASFGVKSVGETEDYYAILNIPKDATTHQVRSAYLRLSLYFHPDKQPPHLKTEAEERFAKVVRAYEVLYDPRKRHVYDTLGEEGLYANYALGPKNMSQEQFKMWLDEQVRRGKMDQVEQMVRSRGEVIVNTVSPRLLYNSAAENKRSPLPPGTVLPITPIVQKCTVKHSFMVGLKALQPILDAPLTFRRSEEEVEQQQLPPPMREAYGPPRLSLNSRISADLTGQRFPAVGVDLNLQHDFPPLLAPPKYPSISSILEKSQVRVFHNIIPQRNYGFEISRRIEDTNVTVTADFSRSIAHTPPFVNIQASRELSSRAVLIMGGGYQCLYPETFRAFGLGLPEGQPRQSGSFAQIGLSILPKLVYSSRRSRRTGKAEIRRERSGQRITAVLVSSTSEICQLRLEYNRLFYPLGIPEDEHDHNEDENPEADQGTPKGLLLNATTSVSLMMPQPTMSLSITQRVTKFSRLGLGYQFVPNVGVVFTINWSRLGQKVAVPTLIGVGPNLTNLAISFLFPLTAYALAEFAYLRPRARREQKRIFKSHLEQIREYLTDAKQRVREEIELMREQVEVRQAREKERGGLVIVYAEYGVPKLERNIARLLAKVDKSIEEKALAGGEARVMIDVTLPVANLVWSGPNGVGQVVVSKNAKKSSIIGFYDPVPFEKKKVLRVRYIFNRVLHEVTVKENEALVIPLREHIIEGQK